MLAELLLQRTSNLDLELHGNLAGKLDIAVTKLRILLKSSVSLFEKMLNMLQSNLSLLQRLGLVLSD